MSRSNRAPYGAMGWLGDLRARFGATPTAPIILRVRTPAGSAAGRVELTATWAPSGRRSHQVQTAAGGLCVVPWRGREREVCVRVRCGDDTAEVTFRRDRDDPGRAREVVVGGGAAEEPAASGQRVERRAPPSEPAGPVPSLADIEPVTL